jgi:hypothetical protein
MSTDYLTAAGRIETAIADIEEARDELVGRLDDAHSLVEHLARVLVESGVQPVTHPEIAYVLGLLLRLLADDGAPEGVEPPSVAEIAERIHWQERRDEE